MKTLTCMIVDDEPLAVKMLEDFVSRTPYLRLAASFNDPVLAPPRCASLRWTCFSWISRCRIWTG